MLKVHKGNIITREKQKRLEELNRGGLKYSGEESDRQAQDSKNVNNMSVQEPSLIIRSDKLEAISLDEAVPGQVLREDDGEFLLIKRRLCDQHNRAGNAAAEFPGKLQDLQNETVKSEFSQLESTRPENMLFLDIETCGLSATPLFLIGAGFYEDSDFSFLQMFARDYDEERPLLSFFNRFMARFDLLVTYNGKSFDLPFIQSRGFENRVDIAAEKRHIDLLTEVRRRWKSKLPDCKLQTVERNILRYIRSGDTPGSEIPRIYHEYISTGNYEKILGVLEHNINDIISMIEIIALMADSPIDVQKKH